MPLGISSCGRCSIHNGRLHQLSRIDRSNGRHLQAALPLNAGCCLCRPQDSLSHGGARPARGCINLHPRPAYLPRSQTLVPISINYRKLWRTHFLRVLCILTPPYLGCPHPLIQTSDPCLSREILNFTDGVGIGCTRKRLENGIKKAENDSEKWAKALYLDTIRNKMTRLKCPRAHTPQGFVSISKGGKIGGYL